MLQSLTVNFFQANFAEIRKLLAFAVCKSLCEENENTEYEGEVAYAAAISRGKG